MYAEMLQFQVITYHCSQDRITTPVLQFDITFHNMPCAWTSLDAMDISGEMHLDVVSQGTPKFDMMYLMCRLRAPSLGTEAHKLTTIHSFC